MWFHGGAMGENKGTTEFSWKKVTYLEEEEEEETFFPWPRDGAGIRQAEGCGCAGFVVVFYGKISGVRIGSTMRVAR
jgi:hypothetical protein